MDGYHIDIQLTCDGKNKLSDIVDLASSSDFVADYNNLTLELVSTNIMSWYNVQILQNILVAMDDIVPNPSAHHAILRCHLPVVRSVVVFFKKKHLNHIILSYHLSIVRSVAMFSKKKHPNHAILSYHISIVRPVVIISTNTINAIGLREKHCSKHYYRRMC